jgi:hypothetical protein
MSRKLDDLHDDFKPLAIELLARLCEAGIPVLVVDTMRTPAEQAEYVKRGVSWTMRSKHLEGRAIDVAPYETYELHGPDKLNWNAKDPVWKRIGEVGEKVGLKWGVWKANAKGDLENIDPGHFEMPLWPKKTT